MQLKAAQTVCRVAARQIRRPRHKYAETQTTTTTITTTRRTRKNTNKTTKSDKKSKKSSRNRGGQAELLVAAAVKMARSPVIADAIVIAVIVALAVQLPNVAGK